MGLYKCLKLNDIFKSRFKTFVLDSQTSLNLTKDIDKKKLSTYS